LNAVQAFEDIITIQEFHLVMKRRNNGDYESVQKRARICKGFTELEEKASEAFLNGRYGEAIRISKIILEIDPRNSMCDFWLGVSYGRKGDRKPDLQIFHLTKYIESEPRRFQVEARISLGRGHLHLGNYEQASQIFKQALQFEKSNENRIPKLWSITMRIASLAGTEDAKSYYAKVVQYFDHLLYKYSAGLLKLFNIAFKNSYPEEFIKMQSIINDLTSIRRPLGNAYRNWNDLHVIYQKHIEVTRPEDHKTLIAFSQSMELTLLNIGLEFADETIRIIHGFLFQV